MEQTVIKEIIDSIKHVKIAVYGDFGLDAYWMLDPRGSEISVETGLQALAVARHYYSLGGASNVVANVAALSPASVQVIGVIGDDIFGRELTRQLLALGINIESMVVQPDNFNTVTFAKPYLEGNELARMDFACFNTRSQDTDQALLAGIEKALRTVDVMIFNQQVPGCITHDSFIDQVNELFSRYSDKIVLLDSRHYGDRFKHVFRKTNDLEAARLNGVDAQLDDVLSLTDVRQYAQTLYRQFSKPVFLTRGPRGIITIDAEGVHEVPGIQFMKKLDTVGAGDTVTSALALCLGAGVSPARASEFANLAAAVTVQKLFQTGTASPEEILEIGGHADYIYQPELAADVRQARYHGHSEIELCCDTMVGGSIKHAVFDHDGTISTLRQGWEQIMVPMMIQAILGDAYKTADETLYHKVRNRVLDYIDKSTGIQTILQMQALAEMVAEFGIVPAKDILDKHGYKQIYNDALMQLVTARIEKFKRGELDIADYTIKGSVPFLHSLAEQGITLYLASGTDHDDVVAEATALGYAHCFDGGIYGALGDVSKYSKKMVIDRILAENNLQGPELAVFGDGPVEIREARKRDGIAVGLASDEVRRHGLNAEKRSRLIKAGAHLIIRDFSQANTLLNLLLKTEN
ncbi:MAG: HAD family hydrolase [Phycisphaerae bacterium]|nr:HAD family hydrolase [Phycisphaerae bacterium]